LALTVKRTAVLCGRDKSNNHSTPPPNHQRKAVKVDLTNYNKMLQSSNHHYLRPDYMTAAAAPTAVSPSLCLIFGVFGDNSHKVFYFVRQSEIYCVYMDLAIIA